MGSPELGSMCYLIVAHYRKSFVAIAAMTTQPEVGKQKSILLLAYHNLTFQEQVRLCAAVQPTQLAGFGQG